jgi:hypothetical protein
MEIHTFIFSWKKVTENALKLYEKASSISPTTFINCDENVRVVVNNIQLDDSYYYGGQFEAAIKAVPDGAALCCIVGDVSPEASSWLAIYEKAKEALSTGYVGVYAPNVDYTWHTSKGRQVGNTLWEVPNTDCTFWFIDAGVVRALRKIPYRLLSNLGWGIDTVVNKESARQGKLVVRDYSELVRQPEGTAYNKDKANAQMRLLIDYYNSMYLKISA